MSIEELIEQAVSIITLKMKLCGNSKKQRIKFLILWIFNDQLEPFKRCFKWNPSTINNTTIIKPSEHVR